MVRLEWVLNMKTYTTYQVLGRLREQVEELGVRGFAWANDIDSGFISCVLSVKKPISERLAFALGFQKCPDTWIRSHNCD